MNLNSSAGLMWFHECCVSKMSSPKSTCGHVLVLRGRTLRRRLCHKYPFLLLLLHFLRYFHLFIWKPELDEETEMERDVSVNPLSRWSQHPRLDKAKAKSQEFNLGFPYRCQGPKYLGRPLIFPGNQKGAIAEVERSGCEPLPTEHARITGNNCILCHNINPKIMLLQSETRQIIE